MSQSDDDFTNSMPKSLVPEAPVDYFDTQEDVQSDNSTDSPTMCTNTNSRFKGGLFNTPDKVELYDGYRHARTALQN